MFSSSEIIKDMHISGPWQEHIAHKAIMTAMEWKENEMIEKAVEWLKENAKEYFPPSYALQPNTTPLLVYYFKKAMKGE